MAPNVQAVLDWVKINRPDCLGQFEEIIALSKNDGGRGDALMFLLTVGFQAGRQYQIDHPELGALSFHTDPPLLKRPPKRTGEP